MVECSGLVSLTGHKTFFTFKETGVYTGSAG